MLMFQRWWVAANGRPLYWENIKLRKWLLYCDWFLLIYNISTNITWFGTGIYYWSWSSKTRVFLNFPILARYRVERAKLIAKGFHASTVQGPCRSRYVLSLSNEFQFLLWTATDAFSRIYMYTSSDFYRLWRACASPSTLYMPVDMFYRPPSFLLISVWDAFFSSASAFCKNSLIHH